MSSSSASPSAVKQACAIFRTPVWYAAVAMLLDTLPIGVTATVLVELINDQMGTSAYLYQNASIVSSSLIALVAAMTWGGLSSPERFGRRGTLVLLSIGSFIPCAVVAFYANASAALVSRPLFAFIGGGFPPIPAFTVLEAWITDWSPSGMHAGHFGLVAGTMGAAMGIGPHIGDLLTKAGFSVDRVLQFAAGLKVLHTLFLLFFFPSHTAKLPDVDIEGDASSAEPSPLTDVIPAALDEVSLVRSGRRLFRTDLICVTWVLMLLALASDATADSSALFLARERHLTPTEVTGVISAGGIGGAVVQGLMLPLVHGCVGLGLMMLVGAICTVLQCLGYAFITDPLALYVNAVVGTIGTLAPLGCLVAIGHVGKTPSESGSMLGAANGLRAVVSSLSPMGLAAWLTYYKQMPPALAWPGSGFAGMALIGLVACFFAVAEMIRARRTCMSGNCIVAQ